MENQFSYLSETLPYKSIFKDQNFINNYIENKYPDLFLEMSYDDQIDKKSFGFWVYRNGKISDQLAEFDNSAKKVTRELANLSFSNNPCHDIMYFSGVLKLILSECGIFYIEACIKPSLDQLISLKDFQKKFFPENNNIFWKIVERRGKYKTHEGQSLDNLFGFNWSRIK
jgi:hypothetical protein